MQLPVCFYLMHIIFSAAINNETAMFSLVSEWLACTFCGSIVSVVLLWPYGVH